MNKKQLKEKYFSLYGLKIKRIYKKNKKVIIEWPSDDELIQAAFCVVESAGEPNNLSLTYGIGGNPFDDLESVVFDLKDLIISDILLDVNSL